MAICEASSVSSCRVGMLVSACGEVFVEAASLLKQEKSCCVSGDYSLCRQEVEMVVSSCPFSRRTAVLSDVAAGSKHLFLRTIRTING